MIDSKDYAPNDESVQKKSDIQSGSEATPKPTDTPTDSPTPTATETPTDTPTATPTDTPTETITEAPTQDYEHSYDKTKFVPGPGYAGADFELPGEFTVEWTATNMRSSEYDFDVFLMSSSEFETYKAYVNDESSHRPQYYTGGTAQGITSSASRTATLPGGKYVVFIDNSDYGDAGDVGNEASREVRLQIETREA